MLKENWRLISRFERVGDCFIVVCSFVLAYYGRDSLIYWNGYYDWGLEFSGPRLAPMKDYFIVLAVGLIGYGMTLQVLGAYTSMRLSSSVQLLQRAFLSSLIVFLALAATLFLLKVDLSRSFIFLFCAISALALTAERYLVLEFLRFWRKRGSNFRNVVVCGIGHQAVRLASEINSRPELGIRVRAFADPIGPRGEGDTTLAEFREDLLAHGIQRSGRILSGPVSVSRALTDYAIDEMIFTDVIESMDAVRQLVEMCAQQGVRTTIAADLFSIGMLQSHMSYFGGMPLIHFQTPPGDAWQLSVKRWIDVALSAVLLILLAPVFLIIALAVKVTSPGPILFNQRRVGQNGRLFTLYKFRSMVKEAESLKAELEEKNEMQGPVFKMTEDPRVTPVGRFLRRHSLDELPQLWNVFIGDMSLVGPRPPVSGEVSMYERGDRRRLSMRPGLTCTWQVSGRSDISNFDSWVQMDLEYIDNWSLTRDLILLFQTIPAVLYGTGAR
jgi:exopolysaccharide biosynthesis polyprenyl glycosylphosphotransferase